MNAIGPVAVAYVQGETLKGTGDDSVRLFEPPGCIASLQTGAQNHDQHRDRSD